ncbi:MAG: sodium:proton antiporter [Bernardetiaceae bacterium]
MKCYQSRSLLFITFIAAALLLFLCLDSFSIDTSGCLSDLKGGEASHGSPAPWFAVVPFVVLLLLIAIGPLFYEHWWHKNYPYVSVALASIVVSGYIFFLHNVHAPIHALAEYVQFIALIASLYVAAGGILIQIDKKGTPLSNVILLLIGAVISNLIGTTGASMLLIRPYMRLNKDRIKPYHVVFFIFIVSNIGGSLTPIGDPPLFLGFLKGIPFSWPLLHNILPWMFAIALLLTIFWLKDRRNKEEDAFFASPDEPIHEYTNRIRLVGTKNFLWLAVVIASVFIDPNVFDWVPGIVYDGQTFSYIREAIMLSVAVLSFRLASQEALRGNEFNFEPIREVGFVFIGIFGTMMPALELVADFAKSPAGAALITPNTLYWGTGLLSGFLDNAPTYLNFLAAAMAAQDSSIGNMEQVKAFAAGVDPFLDSVLQLKAISMAAVFFGAMTYIGNGPNFMVKAIAEQVGVRMPTFFGYLLRFSLVYLLPVLIMVWLIFL